jgi:hypothetical protein
MNECKGSNELTAQFPDPSELLGTVPFLSLLSSEREFIKRGEGTETNVGAWIQGGNRELELHSRTRRSLPDGKEISGCSPPLAISWTGHGNTFNCLAVRRRSTDGVINRDPKYDWVAYLPE